MAGKKWITKTEIKELLKVYSLRNEEFREVAEYAYMNKYIKGYMISIQEEFAGHEKTGRILVLHTQQDGRKTVNDIWERDVSGKLQFRFRNPWNSPTADLDYIKDLENRVEELRQAGIRLKKQLEDPAQPTQHKHNERGAGRKKADEKWMQAFEKWQKLYQSQKSIHEIMEEMQISRATFYRFKKWHENSLNN